MKLLLLTVGRLKSRPHEELLSDYLRRIARICPVSHETVRETKEKDPESMRTSEGERILKALAPRDSVVLLDEKGQMMTSMDMAKWLSHKMGSSKGRLCLVVGGAYGVSASVRERADETIALSLMTLPHDLCLVVLAEQVYRALSILNGSPYHH